MSDPDAEAVRAALRRLASEDRATGLDPDSVLARAESAVEDVRTAADLAERGGFDALAEVVETAERRGDGTTARRGRDALAVLSAYRTAAADHFRHGREGLMGGEQVSHDEST